MYHNKLAKILINVSFICLLFHSCINDNAQPTTTQEKLNDINPIYEVSFEKGQSYGTNENVLVQVGGAFDLTIVGNDGRVYIPDRNQQVIHVFDKDSNYLMQLGHKGRGPGEFISLSSVRLRHNNLYAYDSLLRVINVYSLESLSFSHAINLNSQSWSHIEKLNKSNPTGIFFPYKNKKFLMEFTPMIPAFQDVEESKSKNYFHYYWMESDKKLINNEILRLPRRKQVIGPKGRSSFQLYFHPKSLIVLGSDGNIYTAWSKDFKIDVRDSTGEIINSIEYSFKKAPLTRDEIVSLYDIGYETPHLSKVKKMDLPQSWPALHSLHVDDKNRLWVLTIKEYMKEYQVWILDEQGDLLARFNWPWEKQLEDIKNESIYVTERDEQDVTRIVQYKINFKKR